MNLVDVNPFDELVVLINNLSDEKSKRILLSKGVVLLLIIMLNL